MSKYLMTVAALLVGTGLTMICAGGGLTWLLMIVSGPPRAAPPSTMKTILIRVENVDADEVAAVLRKYKSERGQVGANPQEQLVRITDLPRSVERLKRVLREVDAPPCGAGRYDATDRASGS